MQQHRRLLALLLHGLIAATTTTLHAQAPDVASSLFQQARTKMEAGDFTAACPLLDESYRQDPKPGTLFTLANCRDRQGKLATASGRYGEYIRLVDAMGQPAERKRHAERRTIAEQRIKELEREVPTVKLVWQGGFPQDLKVRIDNVELSPTTMNLALPFDPGEHVIVLQRPGVADFSRRLELKQASSVVVDLSTWENPKSPGAVDANVTDVQPTGSHPRRKAGFVLLGVGGAGIAFGAVMGTLAVLEKQTVDEHCNGPEGYDCDATGLEAVDKMRTYVNPSTIGFIAGGVLAATGLVLVLTAPPSSPEKAAALQLRVRGAPGQGFVGLAGTF